MPRPLLTRRAATAIAGSVLVSCLLALSGASGAAASVAGGRQADGGLPVSLAITSVNPPYARPGTTVTVSGTLTNISNAKISGLSVQLRSSASPFGNRSQLQQYADGTNPGDSPVAGTVTALAGTLAPGATVRWSVPLTSSEEPMTVFGVYPLAAEADSSSQTPLTVSRTFLPFWPAQKGMNPQRQDVAWIWPLIDQPRQLMCAGLLNNGLAASFGPGGRLSGLLQAGRAYARSVQLTWAIDPALLADAATMSQPYYAGGVAGCRGSGGSAKPASQAAAAWLAGVKSATAGQPVFVTPYDDPDIAALIRNNLTTDLNRAFAEGRSVAGQALGRDFSPAAGGPGRDFSPAAAGAAADSLNGAAWPADGIANHVDLVDLAANDGINTVVLDSSTMPPSPQQNFTPSAQAAASGGKGTELSVLLSDDTITQVLGSANAASASQASAFSVAQRYLAETAMIAAERPGLARSIVVAPPRQWDPPAGLASTVLADTVTAPWLRPVSLATLAADQHPAGQVTRRPPRAVSRAQLSRPLLDQVRQMDQQIRLQKSIQLAPDPAFDRAIFAIESSAWRGGGQAGRQASALAQQLSGYLARQEAKLKILVTPREQLVGKSGTVPVSISNRLPYAVKVRLLAGASGGLTVKKQPAPVIVPAGQQLLIQLGVTATAVGSATLTLSLLTPGGLPFPGAHTSMTIQATHYGTLAIVIIAAVLGVFLITSGIRTFRRGRRARDGAAGADPPAGPPDGSREPADASRGAHDAAAGRSDWHDEPGEADTVVSDGTTTGRTITGRSGPGRTNVGREPAEETDDYAWAPGWTDRR